ncbi:MAG: hypothetical protein ABII22_01505 [Candidatus Micrarchaeota archaeon]
MVNIKGQISTEYLVILAVVLVIALVVVYILSQSVAGVSGTIEKTNQAYWAGQSPIAVTGYTASGVALKLTLKNVDAQKLTVTSIAGSGISTLSQNVTFEIGEEKEVALALDSICIPATPFEYKDITFTYAKGTSTGLVESGAKSVMGKCASS